MNSSNGVVTRAAAAVAGVLFLGGPVMAVCGGADPVEGLVFVAFDIQPGVCPNYFNNGPGRPPEQILTTAIVSDDDVQADQILQSSLVLTVPGGGGGDPLVPNCIELPPLETYPEDVTVPIVAPVDCECTTEGPDGSVDLIVRFDADAIADALSNYEDGEPLVLWIAGELLDGTPIIGYDCLFISGAVSVDDNSWGVVKALYR